MLHPSKEIVKLRKRKVKWQEDSEENRFTKPRAARQKKGVQGNKKIRCLASGSEA
jgi:hypothetical protein